LIGSSSGSFRGISPYPADDGGSLDHQRTLDAIERAMAGDTSGLADLYLRYAPGVHVYLRRTLLNERDAEDVTQQVFLKLTGSLRTYDRDRAEFSAWVLRVARNTAIDYLRRQRLVLVDEPVVPTTGPDSDRLERGWALREALDTLTEEQRDVLLLRELVGLTPTEVAARLGKTRGAVNTCHHRARIAAKRALEDLGSTPVTRPRPEPVAA
jgi:RNA polymerase sigma-70 factor (ECF subfamily)